MRSPPGQSVERIACGPSGRSDDRRCGSLKTRIKPLHRGCLFRPFAAGGFVCVGAKDRTWLTAGRAPIISSPGNEVGRRSSRLRGRKTACMTLSVRARRWGDAGSRSEPEGRCSISTTWHPGASIGSSTHGLVVWRMGWFPVSVSVPHKLGARSNLPDFVAASRSAVLQ